jgi:hypothetical protein
MNKIVVFVLIVILIIITGCTDSYEYTLNLRIYNETDKIKQISLLLYNSYDIELLNKSISLEPNQLIKLSDITHDIGSYTVIVTIDYNLTCLDENIRVGRDFGPVSIEVYDEEIKIFQQQN